MFVLTVLDYQLNQVRVAVFTSPETLRNGMMRIIDMVQTIEWTMPRPQPYEVITSIKEFNQVYNGRYKMFVTEVIPDEVG